MGLPLLDAHETEDTIGFFHQSRGQRVKTYYEQMCITQDQLIDNREMNNRRPKVFNPLDTPLMAEYNYAAGATIPTNGQPSQAIFEMQIADMTNTNLPHLDYLQDQARSALNTTAAVLGEALGQRTSASEYLGARSASSSPIFEAIGRFEQGVVVGFMRKFPAYVQAMMTEKQLVEALGPRGAALKQYAKSVLKAKYGIVAMGVQNYASQLDRYNKAVQMYQLTRQDPLANPQKLLENVYRESQVENPSEYLSNKSTLREEEDALFENNGMFHRGVRQVIENDDDDDIHIDIHSRGIWEAKRKGIAPDRISMAEQHNQEHKMRKASKSMNMGGQTPVAAPGQLPTAPTAATPGRVTGNAIAAELGAELGGSPMQAATALGL